MVAESSKVPPPPPSQPKVIVSTGGSHRQAFVLGALAVVSIIGLVASLFLVRQQQDIRSKAASSCDMRWPARADTACGQSTQSPAQGAANIDLSPSFSWDYGGYRTEDNGQCVQLSGCSTYSASVFLWDADPASNKAIARCDTPTQATPPKTVQFSCLKKCDYGNVFPNDPNTCHTDGQPDIGPLKSGTKYWWTVTPYFDGTVHAEQTWNYNFTTGSTNAACQMVSPDKDLTKIQIGDTVKFTGYGSVSSASEKIDKIRFILTKDNAEITNDPLDTVRAADKDSGGSQFYVATKSAQINSAGSYKMRIQVHWQSADKWLE